MKDAKITIEKVEDKGQFKARVTIEILNPIPKSAKFFQQVNPDMVVLDGTHNKIWKHFNTEKQGREWADEMLFAVMRKSWEEVRKYQKITDTSVDIEFHHDHYTPSLLPEDDSSLILEEEIPSKRYKLIYYAPDGINTYFFSTFESAIAYMIDAELPLMFIALNIFKKGKWTEWKTLRGKGLAFPQQREKKPVCFGEYKECQLYPFGKIHDCSLSLISLCKDAPKCIGKYPHHIPPNKCCECPEPYFNICNNMITETKKKPIPFLRTIEEIIKSTEEKPDCFGEHSSHCSACVSNCDFSILCHAKTKERRRKSEVEKPWCFGQYAQCQNSSSKEIRGCSFIPLCKYYQDSAVESEEEEKPRCFGQYENCVCCKDVVQCKIADAMIKKGELI